MIAAAFTLALWLAAQSPSPTSELPVASPEMLVFVREAVQQRLDANAVPDLPQNAMRIPIREDMPLAKMRLAPSALPHLNGVEFYLLSTGAAQVLADQSHRDVLFLTIDSPQLGSDGTGTLVIGMDVVLWRDPSNPRLKMCSFDEQAVFAQSNGRWVFVRRAGWTCK